MDVARRSVNLYERPSEVPKVRVSGKWEVSSPRDNEHVIIA